MDRYIDYNKCIGCHKCIGDCVNQFIYVCDDETDIRFNKPVFQERGRCLDCGHCEAICPVNAVAKSDNFGDGDIEFEGPLIQMSFKRTVRDYIKDSAIDEKIIKLIELAGQSAPTDRNRKTTRILFVKNCLKEVYTKSVEWLVSEVQKTGPINPLFKPTMAMAEKKDEVLWNAEYLVLVVGNPEYIIDAAISAERMQLQADYYKIGTGYRGDMKRAINNSEYLRNLLGLKQKEDVLVAFAMGMTEKRYSQCSIKHNRKVEYL